jgi:4-amino-4-deoxy-L-arabinose transferase-like glycosyltransferase
MNNKNLTFNATHLALFVLMLIPAMLLRDFTPDNELRYLSIADEAIRDGHLFAFYNHHLPYADKPPLYLWLVMLSRLICGRHVMFVLSLFSLIPAVVTTLVMERWTAEYSGLDKSTARLGSKMLLTTGLFLGMVLTVRMDMLMCMFIVLSLYTFYRIYSGNCRPADRWLFPLYIFLGIFSKGPIAILVPLLCIPVFLIAEGRWREIGRYWGWRTWGVLLLLCAVWFGCVYMEGGQEYLDNLLFNQTVNRAVNSFHHKAPFWYYLTSFWYSVAPWCLLIVVAFVMRLRRVSATDTLERFYICVALTTTVMLSLISSKIAVYLLPAFPFFVHGSLFYIQKERVARATIFLPAFIFVLALPATIYMELSGMMHLCVAFHLAAAAITVGGALSLVSLINGKAINTSIERIAYSLLVAVFIGGFGMPSINANIGFREACAEARQMAAEGATDEYVTFGIRRPESMDVFLGTDVEKVEAEDIKLERHKGAVMIARRKTIDEDDEMVRFLHTRPQREVGDYLIVIL